MYSASTSLPNPNIDGNRIVNDQLIASLDALVKRAGEAILDVYARSGDVEFDAKADDSPLTEADRRAHGILAEGLTALTPDWPVLSEESEMPAYAERSGWNTYWLVDPLDGTKEFINRNGEFTVNVALVKGGEPVAGWVWVPVQATLFRGVTGADGTSAAIVERNGVSQPLKVRSVSPERLDLVASRRHGGEALTGLLADIEARWPVVDLKSVGSSLKICMVAEGHADLYPRLAPTSEWDTAAAHAVLRAAGGDMWNVDLTPLRYNQKDSILNPHFYAIADLSFDWAPLLKGR